MPRQTTQYFKLRLILKILMLVFLFSSSGRAVSAWKTLAPGVDYQDMANTLLTPWSHIHVFRIHLNQNELDLVSAKDLKKTHATVEQFSDTKNAQIAINGGFFDEQFHPLGLRINRHATSNELKQISWWGIFQIRNNHPSIVRYSQFRHDNNVRFAIQSGPRLLIHNKIPTLKPGHAERTALGITKTGEVILLVTDRTPMTTTGLAKLMRRSPLNCIDALNLDGGSSSQLFAHFNDFQVKARGFSEVSDAIIVKANLLSN